MVVDIDNDSCMAPSGTGKLMKAVASDAGGHGRELKGKKKIRRQPWAEEGRILRLKKEVNAAWDLWFLTRSKGREAMQEKAQHRKATQQAPAGAAGKAKRKKLVKKKLRREYVRDMAARPFSICPDISDDKLAKHGPDFREMYAAAKFLEDKNREYWNALISQYDERGYAEDETEVTDEEEEEMVEN